MTKEQYWNRPCKTERCCGLASPLSDYCKACKELNRQKKLAGDVSTGNDGV